MGIAIDLLKHERRVVTTRRSHAFTGSEIRRGVQPFGLAPQEPSGFLSPPQEPSAGLAAAPSAGFAASAGAAAAGAASAGFSAGLLLAQPTVTKAATPRLARRTFFFIGLSSFAVRDGGCGFESTRSCSAEQTSPTLLEADSDQ